MAHRVFVGAPQVGGGSTTTINIPAGSLTLTGYAPTVSLVQTIAIPAGALTLTGYAPGVALAFPQGGFARGGDPYRPRPEDVRRLKRLMGFESVREAKRFIKAKPEAARMALAVFAISADPDALVDAVLGETLAERERLKLAADMEAARLIQARIEDETLTLLMILAAVEW